MKAPASGIVVKLLRLLYEQKDWTQEELAHEIGVTQSTLNRWLNGHAVPSRLAALRIVEFAEKQGVQGVS